MSLNSQSDATGPPAVANSAEEIPFADLPREVGVLLLVLGVLGLLLPGPIGTPALVAGGVALWPGTFGRVSRWMENRFPRFTRTGNRQIARFVADLDRRFPPASP